MPYKDDKGIYVAARPPEGGPAETGGFSASSLPWSMDRPAMIPDNLLSSHRKCPDIHPCLPPDRTWHKVDDPKVNYSGDLEEGKLDMSQGSSPAWLCWSSAHLGPDELNMAWWAKHGIGMNA